MTYVDNTSDGRNGCDRPRQPRASLRPDFDGSSRRPRAFLGPDHAAIPPVFMAMPLFRDAPRRSDPVYVRRHANRSGLEIVPVTPELFASVIVPRVVHIERLVRGRRVAGGLRTPTRENR